MIQQYSGSLMLDQPSSGAGAATQTAAATATDQVITLEAQGTLGPGTSFNYQWYMTPRQTTPA
jgi:hypothetical protein